MKLSRLSHGHLMLVIRLVVVRLLHLRVEERPLGVPAAVLHLLLLLLLIVLFLHFTGH